MSDNKYGAGNDGCFWDPVRGDATWSNSEHYQTVQATVIVGADGRWRLCQPCSELPRFKRYRKRVQITRGQCPHPSRAPHGHHEWYTGGGRHPGTVSDMYCRACGKVQPEDKS